MSTYIGWNANTLITRAQPVESWGTEYLVSTLPQDLLRTQLNGISSRAGYIVIVASEDETTVNVQLSAKVVSGADVFASSPGEALSVSLKRGEAICLEAEDLGESFVWAPITDLTGTVVTSNKPISVLAGHLKTGMYRREIYTIAGQQRPDHLGRTPMAEFLPPMDRAGSSFVTVPIVYHYRNISLAEARGGPYEVRGDMIRFVAVDAPITITRNEGQTAQVVARLKRRGEVFEAKIQERAAVWTCTGRALAQQYGKGAIYPLPVGLPSGQPQGITPVGFAEPWYAGSPVLVGATPVSQWVNSATFSAPPELPSTVCIITTNEGIGSLKVNNVGATSFLSSGFVPITGTPYVYIRSRVATNHLTITSPLGFTATMYGHIEGNHVKDPGTEELATIISHGQNIGYATSVDCDDSLYYDVVDSCGAWSGVISVSSNSLCSRIVQTYLLQSDNATIATKTIDAQSLRFVAKAIDGSATASLIVRCVTSSGRYIDIPHTFTPTNVQVTPDSIDLGLTPLRIPTCVDVAVINHGTDVITVNRAVASNDGVVSITPSSFSIPPKGRVDVELCLLLTEKGQNTVEIDMLDGCSVVSSLVIESVAEMGEVYVSDYTWTPVPASSPGIEAKIQIGNRGRVNVVIYGYDTTLVGPDSHFNITRGLNEHLPITLQPGTLHTFFVVYRPLGDTSVAGHRVELPFYTSTSVRDTIAVLNGTVQRGTVSVNDQDLSQQGYSLEVTGTELILHHPTTENSLAHVSVFNLVGMKISSSEQTIAHGSTATRVVQPQMGIGVHFVVVEIHGRILRTIVW
ncbi:MAG: IgGFc-binding protein [Candidatus Kapabacteria bacterium]|nr:IgGFc-binding protein [Candidatus Kapabacteria bacterium]